MEWLYPDEYVDSIYDIDFDKLRKVGYKGILFDIDNTLVPFDKKHPDPKLIAFVRGLQDKGFAVCLVSNNNHQRVKAFNDLLKVVAIPKANKPFTMNLKKGMEKIGTTPRDTMMVGDQLFTDMWAGNQLKLHTILVKPIQEKEEWITRIKRGIEKILIRQYVRKKR